MSRTGAHIPMLENAVRARGLSRHMGSRKLSGKSRETAEVKAMRQPAAKKRLRAVMPRGRMEAQFLAASRATVRKGRRDQLEKIEAIVVSLLARRAR